MTIVTRSGSVQRESQSYRRVGLRGYAKSRQDYDRRRRSRKLDDDGRFYQALVRRDPCSYCGGVGSDADHIVGLDVGGEHAWMNLTGACKSCNGGKKNHSLLLFLLTLSARSSG